MDTPSSLNARDKLSAPRIPIAELVALSAAMMALNAFAIDMMLPALGQIGSELGAANANDRQLIVVAFVIANGVAQLFFGPLVDRFGRKTILMWSIGGYILGSALCIVAPSFFLLLCARAFQGFTTAGARVAAVAIVRDQCSGRKMAEVMSIAVTVFMAAPIIAPAIGQGVLLVGPWRWIFGALLAYGLIAAIWMWIRIPETLNVADRQTLRPGPIVSAYRDFLRHRIAMGYTVASALCFGALFGYISASEQIFLETFEIGDGFAIAFAAIAASLGVATLLNARLVSRYGMRRLSHAALVLFASVNLVHISWALLFGESFYLFMTMMSLSFFALGLIAPNANSIALEPMGHIAGAAAAANGFFGTFVAGLLGGVIARFYDGTVLPIVCGFFFLGVAALILVFWTEKGALFRPHHQDPDQ